ncbi:MAG: hypothetical protein WCC22_06265 [Terriglobales bacterium]
MICPRCLENNPESYRFCGMCGSVLAAVKPAAEPEPARASEKRTPAPVAPPEAKPRPAERVQPGSGPSLVGLNQPGVNQPGVNPPNADSLYDTAFSSMESYFEPGERKPAWRRILLMLVIVAAMGGVAWWGYGSFGWWREGGKPGSPQGTNPGAAIVGHSPTDLETKHTAAPVAPSQQPREAATPGGEKSSNPPANAGTSAAVPAVTKPAEKPAPPRKAAAAAEKSTTPLKSSVAHKSTAGIQTAAAAPAGGDALFRKGEAYLYGRGVPKNCDQAIKYLKLAAAESSAKARSAIGTMYATGHCVPRDLPTSYRWFAQALRADPNNQILEKDLSAVWNQMTPPERQLATKLRQ